MAATIILFDKTKEISRNNARALQLLSEGLSLLTQNRATMISMRDGDGSTAADYDILATQGGYQAGDYADANAAAKASFDELDSLFAVLAAGADDAISQACAKHNVVS